jgi:hypothetical protein
VTEGQALALAAVLESNTALTKLSLGNAMGKKQSNAHEGQVGRCLRLRTLEKLCDPLHDQALANER